MMLISPFLIKKNGEEKRKTKKEKETRFIIKNINLERKLIKSGFKITGRHSPFATVKQKLASVIWA